MNNNFNTAFEEIEQFVENHKGQPFDKAFFKFRQHLNEVGSRYGISGAALFKKWNEYKGKGENIAH